VRAPQTFTSTHGNSRSAAFTLSVASEVSRAGHLDPLVTEVVRRIEQYVPLPGVEALEKAKAALRATDHEALVETTLAATLAARAAWEDPEADGADLASLREQWLSVATAAEEGYSRIAAALRLAAAELGVRSTRV